MPESQPARLESQPARLSSQQARPADPHASPKGPVSKAQESPKTQESPGAQDPWADCLFLSLLEGTTEYTNIWGFVPQKSRHPKTFLSYFPFWMEIKYFPNAPVFMTKDAGAR